MGPLGDKASSSAQGVIAQLQYKRLGSSSSGGKVWRSGRVNISVMSRSERKARIIIIYDQCHQTDQTYALIMIFASD